MKYLILLENGRKHGKNGLEYIFNSLLWITGYKKKYNLFKSG